MGGRSSTERWRARTGSPWRDIPERYRPWETARMLFRRWRIDGTWARDLKKLQVKVDAVGHLAWKVSVDSTIFRTHRHAAGARKRRAAVPGTTRPSRAPPSPSPPPTDRRPVGSG
ncbi:transposase [Streptomyces hirsutus]|uniref:transposase n=1 Tax=Streptomyces hirsutus TaxID=35620 RepID=UPI003F4DFA6B